MQLGVPLRLEQGEIMMKSWEEKKSESDPEVQC